MAFFDNHPEIDLRKIKNGYSYKKWKNVSHNSEYLENTINDAKNKKKVKYTTKYYGCSKFLNNVSDCYKFKKIKSYKYIVQYCNADFLDQWTIDSETDFICSKSKKFKGKIISYDNTRWKSSKLKCKNGCCNFIKKPDYFYIQWL